MKIEKQLYFLGGIRKTLSVKLCLLFIYNNFSKITGIEFNWDADYSQEIQSL